MGDCRRLRRSNKERINGLRRRRADSGTNVMGLMRELLEGHVMGDRLLLLLLLERMADRQTVRNASGREVC